MRPKGFQGALTCAVRGAGIPPAVRARFLAESPLVSQLLHFSDCCYKIILLYVIILYFVPKEAFPWIRLTY